MIQAQTLTERAQLLGPADRIGMRCPSCLHDLGNLPVDGGTATTVIPACARCSFWMRNEGGITIALTPERKVYFHQFIHDYEKVRKLEGRGSTNADYYLALPYEDLTGANSQQWRIRARSYECLEQRILLKLEAQYGRMRILDLGAGNCWLTYRLALRGHHPVAVDLLINDTDGLGAASHYLGHLPNGFPRFQAEMDGLPFMDAQFNCVIFNASFHYSEDYTRTLREALRCLRPGGTILVADSPWYHRNESGEKMLQERRVLFQKRFGTASDSITSREYLTDEVLHTLQKTFGISWQVFEPSYGMRWALRPLIARLRRKREPSRFRIYVAEVRK